MRANAIAMRTTPRQLKLGSPPPDLFSFLELRSDWAIAEKGRSSRLQRVTRRDGIAKEHVPSRMPVGTPASAARSIALRLPRNYPTPTSPWQIPLRLRP